MPHTISLAELMAKRGDLSAREAVAVAQKLIDGDVRCEPRRPFGPPTPDNLRLAPDGMLIYEGGDVTPSVLELGILLQALLPDGSAKASGGLRYTVARTLLDVDVPPFASVRDLGRALRRYEQGDRNEVLRDLIARSLPAVERRRAPASVAEFRRALREADRQIYEMQAASVEVRVVPIDIKVRAGVPARAAASPSPARRMARAPLAAGIAAGLALVAAGQLMQSRRLPPASGAARAAAATAAADDREGHTRSASPPDRPAQVASLLGGELVPAEAPPSSSTEALRTAPLLTREAAPEPMPSVRPDASRRDPATASSRAARSGTRRAAPPRSPSTAPTGDALIVRALDGDQRPVFSPAFASNGTALFFHTGRSADVTSAIASADASSGELRVMTIVDDGARNYHVQPSPDGESIAFDSDRDGERAVYVARGDGTAVRRVSGPGYAAVPTWSPDGRRLAYVRAEPSNARVWNLWLLTLATGELQRLTVFRYGQTWSASWFPGGERIAFTHEDRLIVQELATGRRREYRSPIGGRLVRTAAVSPDGTKVIFQVYRDGGWLLDLADGRMRRVLDDPSAEEFAWSRDGRRVAFHSRRDGEWGIWLVGGV